MRSAMRSFSVLFLILVLAAFSAVAADPAQPPTAGNKTPTFALPNQRG